VRPKGEDRDQAIRVNPRLIPNASAKANRRTKDQSAPTGSALEATAGGLGFTKCASI